MEWSKFSFLDQFLSPRRKLVSGFGFGIGASLIVLTVLFLNNPLKVTQLFQGFSITRPVSVAVANDSDFSVVGDATSGFQIPVDLGNGVEEGTVLNQTHEANFSGVADLGEIVGDAKNGSLAGFETDGYASNGSLVDAGESYDKTHSGLGIFATNVTVHNITGEDYGASVNVSGGNVSSLGEIGESHGGEESSLVIKDRKYDKSCNIFDGRWVRDDTKPYYTAASCPYIDVGANCQLNGRPDDGFIKWKWQPNGCDMPSLNATDFLEKLRGKRLVFVGDSLNRNMWESLVCILHQSVKNKKKVYEISGRKEFKKKGVYRFRFEDYSCSIELVVAPFLVRESGHKNKSGSFETLRLDLMDRTTSLYRDADVIIFNTGHWWTHEKTSKGVDYYQEGNYVHPKLKALEAYRRALTTWGRWIDNNVNPNKTQVFFRGYSVTHFRGGRWNSGGHCHKEVNPIFNDNYLSNYPSKMRALEYALRRIKSPVTYLNITKLTDYRKDGHPSIYRTTYKTLKQQIAAESTQDCSHWCLPGVPDTWNELLYASLLQSGRGSWKN